MRGLNLSSGFLNAEKVFEKVEHFAEHTPSGFTVDGTGSLVAENGGVGRYTSAATLNDAFGVASNNILLPAQSTPVSFKTRVKVTANAAALFIGLSNQTIANANQNGAAGPPASYSGAGFFKSADGNWSVEFSNGGTQDTAELTALNSLDSVAHASGSSSYQLLEVEIVPKTASVADVIFKIDGVTVYKMMDKSLTSLAAMAAMVAGKADSATARSVDVDLIAFATVVD